MPALAFPKTKKYGKIDTSGLAFPKTKQKKARQSHGKSIMQQEKRCYMTGYAGPSLHKHHIFFGSGQREISERCGFWVYLRHDWHEAEYGVHGRDGHELDLRLKRVCQRKFEETHSREEFMALIGRNYLD